MKPGACKASQNRHQDNRNAGGDPNNQRPSYPSYRTTTQRFDNAGGERDPSRSQHSRRDVVSVVVEKMCCVEQRNGCQPNPNPEDCPKNPSDRKLKRLMIHIIELLRLETTSIDSRDSVVFGQCNRCIAENAEACADRLASQPPLTLRSQ